MRSKIYISGILLIIFVLFVGACRESGEWLLKDDEPVQADATIVLMGSVADRVLETSDKYKLGLTRKVIIVEESMGAYKILEARGVHLISNTNQVLAALVAMGIPADSIIILPGDATSTQMEAIIVREYVVNKPYIDTLLLISSAPHTRRASMIFKSAFRNTEKPVCIFCSPSSYTNFDAKKWWRSKEGVQTVLMEYLKIVNFLLIEKRKL